MNLLKDIGGAALQVYNSNMQTRKQAYNANYRAQNADRLRALKREWYRKNKERAVAYGKLYRQQKPEELKARNRADYLANAEKYRERARKYRKLNPEKHQAAVRKYRGRPEPTRPRPDACESCGRVPKISLDLDHCHASGKFRGWLCGHCNRALGMLKDNPAFLRSLASYLERHGGSAS